MKVAGEVPSGYSIGQNGAEYQQGTIRVPQARVCFAYKITLGIRYTGGHHQLFHHPICT